MSNTLALNTQDEIRRLIATGIFLLKLLFQIPPTEIHLAVLFPFDGEQIRVRLDSLVRRYSIVIFLVDLSSSFAANEQSGSSDRFLRQQAISLWHLLRTIGINFV